MAQLLTVTKSGSGSGTVTGTSVSCVAQTGTATVPSDCADVAAFSRLIDVSAKEKALNGVFFKPDGLKMYTTGATNDNIDEYDLSVAWDVTSAVFLQTLNIGGINNSPQDLFIRADGLKVYLIGGFSISSGTDAVHEIDLSVAWDITTGVLLREFVVNSEDTAPLGLYFKSDGTKMFMVGFQNKRVAEYDLSVAWDVSTMTISQFFTLSVQTNPGSAIFLNGDGTKMYIVERTEEKVRTYSLSTSWDVSTAVLCQTHITGASSETLERGIFVRPDETRMYISGAKEPGGGSLGRVMEYTLTSVADNKTVQGVGTAFTTEFSVGEFICLGAENREIATILSNLLLTVTAAFNIVHSAVAVSKVVAQSEIDCGSTCALSYIDNTVVTLTATPDVDSVFVRWTGDITGTTNPDTVTLDVPRTVDAEFSSLVTVACPTITVSSGFGAAPSIAVSSGFGAASSIPVSAGFAACP